MSLLGNLPERLQLTPEETFPTGIQGNAASLSNLAYSKIVEASERKQEWAHRVAGVDRATFRIDLEDGPLTITQARNPAKVGSVAVAVVGVQDSHTNDRGRPKRPSGKRTTGIIKRDFPNIFG